MKKRFTEEQIIGFLREAEAGMPVPTQLAFVLHVTDCRLNGTSSMNGFQD